MAEETIRVPPASLKNKTTSVRSASPRTDSTRVSPASSRYKTTSVRSASPRNGTTRVPPASPNTETTRRRSASPRTETKQVRPDSPRTEATQVAPASPRNKLRGDDNVRSFEISPGSSTSNGKVVPNYPRASTGSCHDFCKLGTRQEHVNEVKESRLWHKSVKGSGPDAVLTKEHEAVTSTKKNGVVKPKPSADSKIQPPSGETVVQEILATPCKHVDVPNEQTLSDTREIVSGGSAVSGGTQNNPSSAEQVPQEISVPSEDVTVTEKVISSDAKDLNFSKNLSTTSKVNWSLRSPSPISKGLTAERSLVGRENVDGRTSLDGRKAFEGRKSSDQTGRRIIEMRSPEGKKSIGERTGVDPERTQKCDPNSISAENNGEGNKNADDNISPVTNHSEYGTSLNLQTNKKDGSLGNSKNDAESELLKKYIAAPKPKIVKMKPLPSLYPSALKTPSPIHPLSNVRSSKSGDNQRPEKISTSRVDAKKLDTHTKFPSSRSSVNGEESSSKRVGFIKVISSATRESKVTTVKEKGPNKQDAQEETAGSVKIPPEKESLASTKVKAKSSITLLPPVLSVSKSIIRSRTSYMPPHLQKSLVGSEPKNTEKNTPGLRKGKAVDVESQNQGPNKPKVRKNPLPRETNQINRPSLRTRDSTVRGRDVVKSSSNSSDRYLLKYPSIGRKKKGQVLFNKVIEETAKRLVRTRKSNVLALVGAFETVISIQKKSSAATRTRPKAKKISSFKKSPH